MSKKVKCWASILGGCGGGQSREHYLTKGLHTSRVKGVGLPWRNGKPFDLPIKSLAANILCKEHNKELSPLDGEAVRMKDFVVRATTPPSDKTPKSSHINYCSVDGSKILSWMSKTICNWETLKKGSPDEVYVRHAFDLPNTSVHVYMNKLFYTGGDINVVSQLQLQPWYLDIKKGKKTQIYIFQFSGYK